RRGPAGGGPARRARPPAHPPRPFVAGTGPRGDPAAVRRGEGRPLTLRDRLARDPWLGGAIALGVFLFGIVVVPQLWLVRASVFTPDGSSFTVEGFTRYLTARRYREALRNSLA